MHDGELRRVTEDHSLVEELVREGRLTPEQAEAHPQRAIVTRALGVDVDVNVDARIRSMSSPATGCCCAPTVSPTCCATATSNADARRGRPPAHGRHAGRGRERRGRRRQHHRRRDRRASRSTRRRSPTRPTARVHDRGRVAPVAAGEVRTDEERRAAEPPANARTAPVANVAQRAS